MVPSKESKTMSKKDNRLEPSELVRKLKIHLARRHDDVVTGSPVGNPSELFYLMSHNIVALYGDEPFEIEETADGLEIRSNGDVDMNVVRQKLTDFINSRPNKNNYTFEQITNPSFLRDQTPSFDLGLLIKSLEIGRDLRSWFDLKKDVLSHVTKSFKKERQVVEQAFLSEMNLPLDLFNEKDSCIDDESDEDLSARPVSQMRDALKKHPVWGTKLKAIAARNAEIENNLFSPEDFQKFDVIGCMPPHIAVLTVRATITIDYVVRFNLDEKAEWLGYINKLSK